MAEEIENDPILAKLNAGKSQEEDPILAALNSPKPTAPSMQGGESGAVKTPSTSTSVLEDLESGSWTKQISEQQPKPAPYQPLVKSQDELNFQEFYKTLPNNLKNSDNYNLKGYWESLGRPKSFDYSQPKEKDGYYHAFSRNPKTGEILKSENHPTFKQALMEDEKAGYKAYKSPEGKVYTFGEDDVVPSGYKPYDWKKAPEPKIAGTITTPVLKIAGLEEPKVTPKSYAPTVQENIAKIEGMTLKTKFPEYAKPTETFDFKKASAQAVSDEEKARQQERIQRSEQRRLDNLPKEIDKLKAERNDLMLDKSVEGRKKLAANEAVTRNFEKELEESKKSEYKSLEKLNQGAVKGLGKEVFEYLQENPKLNDKVKSVGLNDKDTYNLIQNAVQKKIAPLQQDLETFQKEGTVALAAGKINASNLIQSKQNELQGIADELNSYQNNYLKKNGFSAITEQYNQAKKKIDSYTPIIQKINKESEYYKKELNTIKEKIDSYSSKIQGNNFNGTQAELNDYNSLIKEYNETLNDLNSYPDLFKEELNGYENAVSNYNSILAKRNSIAQGLKDTEYNKLSSRYEAARLEYDSMLEQYKKYEEPAVKDRINKYFSTVSQIGEYDNKLKTAKGAMPSIEELEKAKKAFDETGLGGDLLDIGGRVVNSILDASAKLVASPLRLASSFSDFAGRDNVYHYSEYIADLIEGTDREPLFMTKESNNFYDAQKDKINWGAIPVVAGVADQLGILLTLAVTGKYVTPAVEGFMTTAGMDLAAAAEVSESAKIASTIAPAFLISYGDNYKEAIDKGFSSKGAIAYSGALSLLEGITEMIIPDKELLFGKDGKSILLNRFIKDYAKGKKYAVKRLAEGFLYNAFGEATEENIAAIGKTFATTIGHAIDKDIQIDIPTINQTITTSVTSGLTGGGMGIIGQVSEETNMYKMGVAELAKNFQSGKDLLTALKDKGKIEEKRYDKLITDAQKYQAVVGKIPQGLSQFKTIAIAEKMIAINELYSQMDKDEKNPINKINKKKIDLIQDEIAGIIDDKDFDTKFQNKLNDESDDINEQSQPDIALKKYTGATNEKYGYIDRGDGKGKVELTKEEFLKEYYNLYPDLKPTELEEGVSALGEGATETPEPKKISSIAEISNIMAEKRKAAEFLEEMKRKAAEARKRGEEVAFRKEQEAAAFLEEQRKKRDAEVEELKLIRPDLTDDDMLLIDLPDSVDKALDRLEANIPTDMVQVNEAIEALDKKFEQLQAYKNDPNRTHTTEQIDEVVDMLSEAKSKLQFYQLEIENHESRQQQQKSSEGKSETEVSETGAVAEKAETQPTTTEQVEEVKLAELPTKTIQAEVVEEKPKPTEQPKTKEEIAAEIERLNKEREKELSALIPQQKQAKGELDFSAAFSGWLGRDLYEKVFKALQKGGTTVAGIKEPLIDEAKPYFEKGLIKSAEDVFKYVNGKEINAKYDSQITELEKQYEQETKKENGEPMPTGVQGVRTEGEGGKESAELRAEKEKVADPLKDVESTTKALGLADKDNWNTISKLSPLKTGAYKERSDLHEAISEAYHADKAAGKETELTKAVEQLLGKPTEEKVSGGLTQEEKTNLETIAKEAGVNFQEVRNVYNKYGEGKPLNEITLEDYQKAQEKRQKQQPTKTTKNAVQEQTTSEIPIQPETRVGEGVEEGKPETKSEKATQEGVQEKIDALVDKSLPASERRKIMQENPLIKRIFDNIKELHKQLEEKGLITKEGNCP